MKQILLELCAWKCQRTRVLGHKRRYFTSHRLSTTSLQNWHELTITSWKDEGTDNRGVITKTCISSLENRIKVMPKYVNIHVSIRLLHNSHHGVLRRSALSIITMIVITKSRESLMKSFDHSCTPLFISFLLFIPMRLQSTHDRYIQRTAH